jgi:hypothetical protein
MRGLQLAAAFICSRIRDDEAGMDALLAEATEAPLSRPAFLIGLAAVTGYMATAAESAYPLVFLQMAGLTDNPGHPQAMAFVESRMTGDMVTASGILNAAVGADRAFAGELARIAAAITIEASGGHEQALENLRTFAEASAALADDPDLDGHFK